MTTSIDGYVADKNGSFTWTQPSEELLAFVNDALSNVGTFLLGRHMYETLAVWDTISTDGSIEGVNRFAEIWRTTKKIVYSTSLSGLSTADATIERVFDSKAVQKMLMESDKDFGIGGPHLAAEAIKVGLVDEYHQTIVPVILGGGNYWLPKSVEAKLELAGLQKFDDGVVHLQYNRV